VLHLLAFLVATVVGAADRTLPRHAPAAVHDFATLTDAEARRLADWPALYRVAPDGDAARGWRFDCQGEGAPLRSLWLGDGDDVTAARAAQDSGLLLVEATLRRIVHPPVTGADGSRLPALVEYRLTRAAVVERPGW
jgi:hypothetical protein